jgi:predicted NBD/HSP70 family sugar kinase
MVDMYAGIDIGGSKTLAASLDDNGVILQKIRFETPKNYDEFLAQLATAFGTIEAKDFRAAGVGAPGSIDRKHGRGVSFGNLGWRDIPLAADIEQIVHCPVVIENDAKLAALSEAMLVKDAYDKVLYVTVSTGIGLGLVVNQMIDTSFGDGGGRTMLVEHNDKLVPWESFASGHAIVERYGKMAKDIDDEQTWRSIARDLSVGFLELIALTQPGIVVIGGSVGTHFKKYEKLLVSELKKYETPLFCIPPIIGAARAEEAVLYGGYDLAKATYL